jgi:predicted DNA-binding protein (MmcQ/YjbR family)
VTTSKIQAAELALRDIAMAYPEAHEDFPWGERAIKIKGKVFVFLHASAERLSLTTKLPASSEMALLLPNVSPTGYGLGKSGWVTAKFGPHDEAPLEMLREWIDESFRAVAPKKLVAAVDTPVKEQAGKAGVKTAVKTGARAGAATAAKGGAKAKSATKVAKAAKGGVAKSATKVAKGGVAKSATKVAKAGVAKSATKVAKGGAAKSAAKGRRARG